MIDQAISRLEELAESDTVVAPLAVLQAEALRASADSLWDSVVPDLERRRLDASQPLLNGQSTRVDPEVVRGLFARLVAVARQHGPREAEPLRDVVEAGDIDVLAVLEASVSQDTDRLKKLATSAGLDFEFVATVGQLATLPLLQACGRKAAPLVEELDWHAGYCPVCAAWPTLAESRGLERRRWLRCGRCGSAWSSDQQRCVFCDSRDHRHQGYLAPEAERDSRRAVTCGNCRGYLKSLATIAPISPAEIGLQYLTSIELDMAALQQEYRRPERPGFELQISIEPAASV